MSYYMNLEISRMISQVLKYNSGAKSIVKFGVFLDFPALFFRLSHFNFCLMGYGWWMNNYKFI